MKVVLPIACVAAAIAAFFLFFQSSSADRLTSNLRTSLGEDSAIALEACNLSIVQNNQGDVDSPIALTRVVIQADLRNYSFRTVRIFPSAAGASMRIGRKSVDALMLSHLSRILEIGGARVEQLMPDEETAKAVLEDDDGSLFFRVMAEVVMTESGAADLVAHEDAPDFFDFASAVEATAAPISYRSTTTFASSAPSAETLLTGEVVAIPFLQFAVASEEEAKELARAFQDYSIDNACY